MNTISKNQLDHIGNTLKLVVSVKKAFNTKDEREEQLYRAFKQHLGYSSDYAEEMVQKISLRFF